MFTTRLAFARRGASGRQTGHMKWLTVAEGTIGGLVFLNNPQVIGANHL